MAEKNEYVKNIDSHYSEIIKNKDQSVKEMTKITVNDNELSANFKRLLIKNLAEKETNNIKELCREMKCCDVQTQTDANPIGIRNGMENEQSGDHNNGDGVDNTSENGSVIDMAKLVNLSYIQSDAVRNVPLTTLRIMNLPSDFGAKEVEDLFGLNVISEDVKQQYSSILPQEE